MRSEIARADLLGHGGALATRRRRRRLRWASLIDAGLSAIAVGLIVYLACVWLVPPK